MKNSRGRAAKVATENFLEPSHVLGFSQKQSLFTVFRCSNDEWCARRADGLVCGYFTNQDSAITFAKREGRGILPIIATEHASVALLATRDF